MIDIKKSICQIICQNQINGTGFYIGQGRIITAAHVVEGFGDVQACFTENEKNQYIYDCQLQEIQPDTDIYIMLINEEQNDLVLSGIKLSFRSIAVNSKFLSYGYPGENQGNMSFISGTVLNAHDGCNDTVYTVDLEVERGKLHNYQGFSGAPVIIENVATGICVYQNNDQLRMVEFSKNVETLMPALDLKPEDEKRYISNVTVDIKATHFISRAYLEKAVYTQIIEKKTSQIFIIKGCNGVGKTTWIDLLENWGNMNVIGKYYINKYDDKMPSVYRKSEEALYDWFCMIAGQFLVERIEIAENNSYVERLKCVNSIFEKLDQYLESIDKFGLICVDGLDEFVNDDMRLLDIFCSYFTAYKGTRISFIFTLNNENILPRTVQNMIVEENILEIQPFDVTSLRLFLLNNLNMDGAEKYVDQLVEKSEGHALYLHYIIDTMNNLTENDDIDFIVNDFPAYGGNIYKYYDYKWNDIRKNENSVKLVAYLARTRINIEKQILLQMVSTNERIALDVALDNMGGLLVQGERISFFHSSFQKYVSDKTKYLDEEIHHAMATYCLGHQNFEYGVTQLLYHLSKGNEEDKKQCILLCNQTWMDKCGGFNGGPEVMLQDMQTVVGLCCEFGAFAQLIDKLLLMQRAQVRYDEIFARFAGDLAMAEIELNRPGKALEYLYRFNKCLVNDEQLLACLQRLISKEYWDYVDLLIERIEKDTFKYLFEGQPISLSQICTMNRVYQMAALSGSEYYYEKGKKYLQIIFSQELDDLEADFIMQSSTDYNLWKNGVVATAESLETAGIPVDQKTYNNWILSIIGASEIENYTEKRSNDWLPVLKEIAKLKEKQKCKCDESIRDIFIDVCMCRREYAALLPKEYIVNASKLEVNSIRDKNGVDIDYQKIHNLFVQNRNTMYLDRDGEKCTYVSGDIWKNNWEKGLCQLVACVGSYYGLGLMRTKKEDVEEFKQILERSLFSFDERTNFEHAYHIPEKVMEYIFSKISLYFFVLYPEETEWFVDYVKTKSKDQFGIYYEGYFRIMIGIISVYQQQLGGDDIIEILKISFADIISKVANRYERTNLLLQMVKYFVRTGCEELAETAYKEMLKGSMGPLWYKEAQYSLLEQSIENMQKDDIDEQIIKQSMAILDAASGGMTFERYIRTTKESIIEKIWKKGKYRLALDCMNVQLLPKEWQALVMSSYEPVDQKHNLVGNYRVANCIFPQRMMYSILNDSNIPDDFRWAFSEIFMLVERRNFHHYIKIQADILSRGGRQKKNYYDRIVNVLACDSSQYYCKDLLVLYQQYLTDDEYEVVVELLEEYTGQIHANEKSGVKIDETFVELEEGKIQDDEKDELYLPGTWGKRCAIRQAEQIWNEIQKEEKKQNISKINDLCKEIIRIEEDNGWAIWNHGADKYANMSIKKLSQLAENPNEFLNEIKDLIKAPKYSARWQEVEKLLEVSADMLTKEEKRECYTAIITHYKEMMNIPESLIGRYKELRDAEMSVKEAVFEMLLNYMIYPQHYISQKSIEMFSWIMEKNDSLIPLLIKYCQSENLEIAEICSCYCLKLAERLSHPLMKELERTENLDVIICQIPWMIVRGNLYLVLKQYTMRSGKLKSCFDKVSGIFFKEQDKCDVEEAVNIQNKFNEINHQYHCMEDSQFQIICNAVKLDKKLLDEFNQDLFNQYAEVICAGFHDSSLKILLWRNKWYELLNSLQFDYMNQNNMCDILNALRRVNWTFPLPDAKNAFAKRKFYDIKRMLLESDSTILNAIFGGKQMVLAYHGVKLEKDNIEIASIRSFFVSKQLSEKEMVMEVVQCIGMCGISDYPYKSNNVNTCNVNEITARWYPGSMIGYNFSSKMFNLDIINKAGISMNAVEEGAFIGDREWEKEQSGRPDFYCAYGSIEKATIQKDREHKVLVYIEYQCNSIDKKLLVDIDNHAVIFM